MCSQEVGEAQKALDTAEGHWLDEFLNTIKFGLADAYTLWCDCPAHEIYSFVHKLVFHQFEFVSVEAEQECVQSFQVFVRRLITCDNVIHIWMNILDLL